MTVAVRIAGEENLQALSRKLLRLIEDKESQVYQDNVAKFGIPDDYVKKAFSEETLLKASKTQNARFYLAVEDDEITGFAQFVRQDDDTAELDRILVFPGRIGKGIGTELLHQALADQREKGVKMVIGTSTPRYTTLPPVEILT